MTVFSYWKKLGLALQKITSPVFLFVIYFFLVTPWSLVIRVFRRDPLRLKPGMVRLDDDVREFGGGVFSKPF